MTRKHFNAIANILKGMAAGPVKDALIEKFVEFFSECNPRFDADRFREAC